MEEATERAASDFEDAVIRHRQYLIDKDNLRLKYEKMLNEVKMWQPPTSEHIEMKLFMIQQIESSIEWDCSTEYDVEPVELSPEMWFKKYRDGLIWDLDYHTKEWEEEVERCSERTKWIRELKKSLIEYEKRKEE